MGAVKLNKFFQQFLDKVVRNGDSSLVCSAVNDKITGVKISYTL